MPIRRRRYGVLQIQGTPAVGSQLVATRVFGSSTVQWQAGTDPSFAALVGETALAHVVSAGESGQYDRIVETRGGVSAYSTPVGPMGGTRSARVTWASMDIGAATTPRAGRVTWASVDITG